MSETEKHEDLEDHSDDVELELSPADIERGVIEKRRVYVDGRAVIVRVLAKRNLLQDAVDATRGVLLKEGESR